MERWQALYQGTEHRCDFGQHVYEHATVCACSAHFCLSLLVYMEGGLNFAMMAMAVMAAGIWNS